MLTKLYWIFCPSNVYLGSDWQLCRWWRGNRIYDGQTNFMKYAYHSSVLQIKVAGKYTSWREDVRRFVVHVCFLLWREVLNQRLVFAIKMKNWERSDPQRSKMHSAKADKIRNATETFSYFSYHSSVSKRESFLLFWLFVPNLPACRPSPKRVNNHPQARAYNSTHNPYASSILQDIPPSRRAQGPLRINPIIYIITL